MVTHAERRSPPYVPSRGSQEPYGRSRGLSSLDWRAVAEGPEARSLSFQQADAVMDFGPQQERPGLERAGAYSVKRAAGLDAEDLASAMS